MVRSMARHDQGLLFKLARQMGNSMVKEQRGHQRVDANHHALEAVHMGEQAPEDMHNLLAEEFLLEFDAIMCKVDWACNSAPME
eukprot:5751545-Ditylum_brightwellii.AAC.1